MTRAQAILLLALTRLIGCRRLQYPDNNREFYILYFIKRYSKVQNDGDNLLLLR